MIEIARDIEECLGCPDLVFPGDEVFASKDGLTHIAHESPLPPFMTEELAGA